ncbi:MAG: nicotinamide-nucleotide adenylyltransferase [Candidatus Altiarchaeales archaeon ex4484_96]|nr:MAG: nicotinamide-nucleotide adenylyltransferase [Candidatus Altiarchaeales archaeon ex4484_96]
MSRKGLIVGRFQPFHFGHLKFIEWVANDVDYLIIGVGSSQESHTLENPFSASERRDMIKKSLKTRIRYEIVEINDINNDNRWVSHVEEISPEFDVVYANGEKEKNLFKNEGYEVKTTPMFNKKQYSGTEIRNRMIDGRPWHDFVPQGTIEVIERIDGAGRVRRLYESYSYRD